MQGDREDGDFYGRVWSVVVMRSAALVAIANRGFAHDTPASADRPWHAPAEMHIEHNRRELHDFRIDVDPGKTHRSAELLIGGIA